MITNNILENGKLVNKDACRLCLRKQEKTFDLFRTKILKGDLLFSNVFNFATNLNISEDDGLPSKLCWECAERLSDAYQLKRLAVQSDRKLQEKKKQQQQHESNSYKKLINDLNANQENNVLNSDSDIELNLITIEKAITKKQVEKLVHEQNMKGHSPRTLEEKRQEEDCSFVDVEELDMHLVYEDSDENVNDNNHNENDSQEDGVQFLQNVMANNLIKRSTTTTQDERKKRRRRRSATTVHKCQVCERIFARKSNLVDHLRLHAKVKLFQCSYCIKSFVQIANYRTHMRTHTKERPFKCTICSKAYTQTSALKIHIRSHTQERNYICAQCGKTFTNASDLSKHAPIHDPLKQFQCAICQRQFAQKVNMMSHQRRMHGSIEVSDDEQGAMN